MCLDTNANKGAWVILISMSIRDFKMENHKKRIGGRAESESKKEGKEEGRKGGRKKKNKRFISVVYPRDPDLIVSEQGLLCSGLLCFLDVLHTRCGSESPPPLLPNLDHYQTSHTSHILFHLQLQASVFFFLLILFTFR